MQKLFFFSIILLLFVGVNVLSFFAWNIEDGKVSFVKSLLPALYILFPLLIVNFFSSNFKFLFNQKKEEFHLLFFLLFIVIIKWIWGHNGYLGGIVNALFLPVFVSVLMPVRKFKDLSFINFDFKSSTRKIIFYFFIIECSTAIFERIFMVNLFPITLEDGTSFISSDFGSSEFRSTALVNHPLQNALSVSIIMSFILISSIRDIYKYLLWILGFLAVLCFNTRSSIFIWIILLVIYVGHTLFINKKISVSRKSLLILSSFFIVIAICYLIFVSGWGGRLINMGLLDDGSSAVRIKIWDVFENYEWEYFMIGHDNTQILKMINTVDVYIVENYWLIYIFTYGFLLTVGLVYFFSKLFKRLITGFSGFSKIFILSCFLLISSTNNSLSVASPAMAIFIICCYIFNPSLKNTNKKIQL